jgi:hypothetical protein
LLHHEPEPVPDTKDRLRGELDCEVNRQAESEIQGPSRKLNLTDEKLTTSRMTKQK